MTPTNYTQTVIRPLFDEHGNIISTAAVFRQEIAEQLIGIDGEILIAAQQTNVVKIGQQSVIATNNNYRVVVHKYSSLTIIGMFDNLFDIPRFENVVPEKALWGYTSSPDGTKLRFIAHHPDWYFLFAIAHDMKESNDALSTAYLFLMNRHHKAHIMGITNTWPDNRICLGDQAKKDLPSAAYNHLLCAELLNNSEYNQDLLGHQPETMPLFWSFDENGNWGPMAKYTVRSNDAEIPSLIEHCAKWLATNTP